MIFLDILYPRRCVSCDRAVIAAEAPLCARCEGVFRPIGQPRCLKCSKPIADETAAYCADCRTHPGSFRQGIAVYAYSGRIQESMMRFKYKGRQEYAAFYGDAIAEALIPRMKHWRPELILPVPLHPSRYARRGYNQAELLAKRVGGSLDLPVRTDLLARTKKTKALKTLSASERRQALSQSFAVSPDLPSARILLIDDIYTTGSTIDAITRLLLAAGAAEVYYAAACIGSGDV